MNQIGREEEELKLKQASQDIINSNITSPWQVLLNHQKTLKLLKQVEEQELEINDLDEVEEISAN